MDHYTKTVLTVIALNLFVLPVKAEEKIWYCTMDGIAQADKSGAQTYKTERFTMKVSPTRIIFGSDGVLEGMDLQIRRYTDANDFSSNYLATVANFYKGRLHIATAGQDWAVAISARCEDF